jgi:LruC domain-containing protein
MTRFVYLSNFSFQGVPDKLNLNETGGYIKQIISPELVEEVDINLPGGITVVDNHPEWVRNSDLKTNDECEITTSFITEGAGYRNGLGYYVYDTDSPPNRFSDIDVIYIIFPNASRVGGGGLLSAGDTMKLVYKDISTEKINGNEFMTSGDYTFPAKKGIGFVCFANQWKGNGRSWAYLNTGHRMYSTDPALNPEYSKKLKHHAINYKSHVDDTRIIFGFEDLRRDKYSDDDFNDLVYLVTSTPGSAIDSNCINSIKKQHYSGHIICEDIFKNIGDFDYNDLTLKYNILEELENKKIKSITMKFCGKHRGASYNHEFGVIFPNIKSQINCKIFRETHVYENNIISKECLTNTIIHKGTDKIPIIENTKAFLPGFYTNTTSGEGNVTPSYVILKIVFPVPIERSVLNGAIMPYRFYLDIYTKSYTNIDHSIYSDIMYPSSTKLKSLGVDNKKKILILEGCDNFKIPLEKIKLHKAYPKFITNLKYNTFQNWSSYKYANKKLLKDEIVHTESYQWDQYLINKSNTCYTYGDNKAILLLPVKFDDTLFEFNETGVLPVLQKNNFTEENLLKWENISQLGLTDYLIDFVKNYGHIYIRKGGDYTITVNDSEESFYLDISSNNHSQPVHSSISGTSDVLNLLSGGNEILYTVCDI